MKKILALILAFVMLSLCACDGAQPGGTDGTETSGSGVSHEATFRAGYAQENITPREPGVNLRGFGDADRRLSTGIISYIYVTCLALSDENDNTALIMSFDICSMSSHNIIRQSVSEATGVPVRNIITSCSHQHSTPDDSLHDEYRQLLLERSVEVAVAAMADRAPAAMEVTTTQTENLNFVRHYIMNDGTYAGDNFGSTASGYKEHVSEPDRSMQLVKFKRQGDQKDILLTNFQGHPHMGSKAFYTDIHADTVGVYRDIVSEALDCEVIYFSGAGGNVKMTSAIESENLTTDFKVHGGLLAQYAIKAEGTYTPIASGTIRALQSSFTAKVDHSEDHLLDVARNIYNEYKSTNSMSQAMKLAGDSGISSYFHANAILTKHRLGSEEVIENLGAISVGDLAFIAAPYEMFDQSGVFIKENSPYTMTIVTTIANGGNGYFPILSTFDYGGYEADTSKYVPGTAEGLAQTFVDMLNELHGK